MDGTGGGGVSFEAVLQEVWQGMIVIQPVEVEFLNKMPNPCILESWDLRFGGIQRYILPNYF
jgi:hypothetical protein